MGDRVRLDGADAGRRSSEDRGGGRRGGQEAGLSDAGLLQGEVGARERRERRRPAPAGGQQHRGDLRPRDPRVERGVAAGPRGGHRRPPRGQWRREEHDAEIDLRVTPDRARQRLMLLDEPSMGLAPILVQEIFEIVSRMNREAGVAVLLAEQNATMALRFAQYGYVMENGRIVLDGDARTIGENEDIKEFYLGLSGVGQRKSYRDVKHYRRRKRWLS